MAEDNVWNASYLCICVCLHANFNFQALQGIPYKSHPTFMENQLLLFLYLEQPYSLNWIT